VVKEPLDENRLWWEQLSDELRADLIDKLSGLWDTISEEEVFNSLSVDKQLALVLILSRLRAKSLWQLVRKITNLYGKGGVGIEFTAWPMIESTLSQRTDFTRRFANHRDTSGGFYEKGRDEATLHFLQSEAQSAKWYVHFDLYSPVNSSGSALKHLRHEFLGKVRPDWRMIHERLNT
jgi:hypothetical protein